MGYTLFSADSQLSMPANEARTLSPGEEAEGRKERSRADYHGPAARKLLWLCFVARGTLLWPGMSVFAVT